MTTFEPGTLAVATVRGVPNVRVMRTEGDLTSSTWASATGVPNRFHESHAVTDIHPLVVLDPVEITGPDETGDLPPESEIVNCLRRLAEGDHPDSYRRRVAERIADAVEAQTRPPKPAEPTGLGAVVEDAVGRRWVRASRTSTVNHWRCADEGGIGRKPYDRINVVRVLSEGVTA